MDALFLMLGGNGPLVEMIMTAQVTVSPYASPLQSKIKHLLSSCTLQSECGNTTLDLFAVREESTAALPLQIFWKDASE